MKDSVCILSRDIIYGKKFCNIANKIYGLNYFFIFFDDIKKLIEYKKDNKITAIVVDNNEKEEINDIECIFYYFLTEIKKDKYKEGKRTYLYKYQKINNILDVIDCDISNLYDKNKNKSKGNSKVLMFYTPYANDINFVKSFARAINKNNKILFVDLDEYNNFKSNIGFSNLIYLYKENALSIDGARHEILFDKDLEVINSVTYPEDFNVINNIDLSNIINILRKLNYDYIILNADNSYCKNQYLMSDADKIILYKNNKSDNKKIDALKTYIKLQSNIDIKKIYEYEADKRNISKTYIKELLNE